MRKSHKYIVTCICIAGAGILISGIGHILGGRVYGIGLNSTGIWVNTPNGNGARVAYIEEQMELDDFDSMDIDIEFGTLKIEPADHFGVAYGKSSVSELSIDVTDGHLTIIERPKASIQWNNGWNRNQIWLIGMGSSSPWQRDEYLTVYLPQDAVLKDVTLQSESGSVSGSSITADSLKLTAEFGNVTLDGITCADAYIQMESGGLELTGYSNGNLTVKNDFGNSVLKDISAKDMTAEVESGNFSAENTSADNLTLTQEFGMASLTNAAIAKAATVTSESGDIELNGFSANTLSLDNSFGSVSAKDVTADTCTFQLESGDCKIDEFDTRDTTVESQYGNVTFTLTNPILGYFLDLDTEFGEIKINREKMGEKYKTLDAKTSEQKLVIKCESGTITLED